MPSPPERRRTPPRWRHTIPEEGEGNPWHSAPRGIAFGKRHHAHAETALALDQRTGTPAESPPSRRTQQRFHPTKKTQPTLPHPWRPGWALPSATIYRG